MANLTLPVDDHLLLAKESLRLFSELRRSGVPVSPTTLHALLNEATLAIEAIRTTVQAPEKPSETLARLAPWAEIVIPAAGTVTTPQQDAPAPARRTRRTKAEMEADAAAEAAAKKAAAEPGAPVVHAAEPSPERPVAVTNPMPVESATFTGADPAAGVPVIAITTTPEGGLSATSTTVDALPAATPPNLPHVEEMAKREPFTQPGFDREKAEAVLKKTGDDFRAADEKRREREALATTRPVAIYTSGSTAPYPPTSPEWKTKLHLAPKPEDTALPFKNGDYAGKKFSDCSIRDLEIIMANYVKGVEAETDPEKRSQRALWLERGAAWHRYQFDLLLMAAGDLDLQELAAEYATKASAPGPSPAMQMHRKMWKDRVEEIAKARKENEA